MPIYGGGRGLHKQLMSNRSRSPPYLFLPPEAALFKHGALLDGGHALNTVGSRMMAGMQGGWANTMHCQSVTLTLSL